jgi:hypothetical protein
LATAGEIGSRSLRAVLEKQDSSLLPDRIARTERIAIVNGTIGGVPSSYLSSVAFSVLYVEFGLSCMLTFGVPLRLILSVIISPRM